MTKPIPKQAVVDRVARLTRELADELHAARDRGIPTEDLAAAVSQQEVVVTARVLESMLASLRTAPLVPEMEAREAGEQPGAVPAGGVVRSGPSVLPNPLPTKNSVLFERHAAPICSSCRSAPSLLGQGKAAGDAEHPPADALHAIGASPKPKPLSKGTFMKKR